MVKWNMLRLAIVLGAIASFAVAGGAGLRWDG
jgi:hypothetical protein